MSIINEIGATAFIIAAYRAEEEANNSPLFVDSYAKFFVTDEIMKKANDFTSVFPEGKEMIRYRIKFFDDTILSYINQGTTQFVLLGGGFDMRACKYAKQGIKFYDLDQAPVLNFKQSVIAKNNIDYPSTSICCDYLLDDIVGCLTEKGFNANLPSLFIWEGNTLYITKEKIYSLLSNLGKQLDNFNISFDYIAQTVVTRTSGIESVTKAADFFENMGSPWITGFDDVRDIEKNTSLKVIKNFLMKSLEKKYFPDTAAADPNILSQYSVCILSN